MKKRKILVIDDEKDFCFLMTCFFAPRNFEVHCALTLKDGMKMLMDENPDVLFLDNNLPDGFGWEKTDFILKNHPSIQLNLISAVRTKPSASATSFRVLEKPFRWDAMKDMIDEPTPLSPN